MKRLALLSVYEKTGLLELAKELIENFNFEIISSGGTATFLQAAGLPVTSVSDYTGAPEILGGRVKTLHPRLYGGILARRNLPEDLRQMEEQNIRPFDLVVVNLYPFEKTVADPKITLDQAIEQIDIGGPTLLRAAAKNFAHLTVLCDPIYYTKYLEQKGEPSVDFRQSMALATFKRTQAYDLAISNYFSNLTLSEEEMTPYYWTLSGQIIQPLRYGENPHQKAAWYKVGMNPSGWSSAEQLQGKELSYNNLVDLEAARRLIAEFPSSQPAAAILKHTNPCGVALGSTLAQAYTKAFNADSLSAFGGIVSLNQSIDLDTAQALIKTFLECIVAPGCDPEAREVLATKSNLRVLLLSNLISGSNFSLQMLAGGFLLQSTDTIASLPEQWKIVTQKQPSPEQLQELLFAWKVVKHTKSNAIVVTKDLATLGVGAGQMNRVGSVEIALAQAQNRAAGATLASDGFFPFDDSVRKAAAAGISAIVQPGGSVRDVDSIKAADELGLVMLFTGIRHFLH